MAGVFGWCGAFFAGGDHAGCVDVDFDNVAVVDYSCTGDFGAGEVAEDALGASSVGCHWEWFVFFLD